MILARLIQTDHNVHVTASTRSPRCYGVGGLYGCTASTIHAIAQMRSGNRRSSELRSSTNEHSTHCIEKKLSRLSKFSYNLLLNHFCMFEKRHIRALCSHCEVYHILPNKIQNRDGSLNLECPNKCGTRLGFKNLTGDLCADLIAKKSNQHPRTARRRERIGIEIDRLQRYKRHTPFIFKNDHA